jgi:hypothetical protein
MCEDETKELQINSVHKKINTLKQNWTKHLERSVPERLPRQMLNYRPRLGLSL